MPRISNSRLRFIIGLAGIVILYTFYNLLMLEGSWFMESISRSERHVIKFATVLLAYGIGFFAFARLNPGWLIQLWHLIYAIVLLLLILAGLYESWAKGPSTSIRDLAVTLHEFLISPIPYVFVAIIGRASGRMTDRG